MIVSHMYVFFREVSVHVLCSFLMGLFVFTRDELDDSMKKVFEIIRNDEKLKKMRIRLKPLKKPNAAEEIIASLDIWRN